MAYGTINSTIINHYNKTSYTLDGTTYSNIHVFKTNPNSETVSPAVYTTGNKKMLTNMNPNGIAASKVMAKTNGNTMEYYSSQGDSFTTSSDGYTVLNPNDYYDESCHYNRTHCGGRETQDIGRTFLGHKSDGSYLMVVCESMSLVKGSKLMADLGCDYAINLDGNGASQMRVSSQYLNNVSGVSAGKVTATGSDGTYYGTAVIAHTN